MKTCDACGQPIPTRWLEAKCAKCGGSLLEDGGTMVKVDGVCTPYHFACAPAQPKDGQLL